MIDDQLNLAIETARGAAQRGDFATAIETQERVLTHIRLKAQTRDELITLSVQLFNLGDYYAGAERFTEAIVALEQVVAFDEKLGLPDVESDRQMLEQVRKLAGMTSDERSGFYAAVPPGEPTLTDGRDSVSHLLDQVEGIESIDRAELEQVMRDLQDLPPEEQLRRVMELRGKAGDQAAE